MEMEVVVSCRKCGKEFTLKVKAADYKRWKFDGALIQNAMPYLDAAQRELLISGTCGSCFVELFKEDES